MFDGVGDKGDGIRMFLLSEQAVLLVTRIRLQDDDREQYCTLRIIHGCFGKVG